MEGFVPLHLKKEFAVIVHPEESVINLYSKLRFLVFPVSHTHQCDETKLEALFDLYTELRARNLVSVTIESVDTMKRWHRLWANQANPPELGVVDGIFDAIAKDLLWDVRRHNLIVGDARDLLDRWMVFE